MKNSIGIFKVKPTSSVVLSIAAFLVLFVTSCGSPSHNANTSKDDTRKVQAEQNKARVDYEADVNKYRLETNRKINANDREIENFESRMEEVKEDSREAYESNLNDLRDRNDRLKKKMEDYKADKESDWDSFKKEFNRDMDDLGTSLKNFGNDSE